MLDRGLEWILGYGPHVDPYGPPLADAEVASLTRSVSDARADAMPPYAHVLHDAGRAQRWAILAPPYGGAARDGSPGLYALHARALAREGLGVVMFALPYHGARAPEGRPSGWGFVRADLASTQRALAQSGAECAGLARRLREQGAATVAGFGISLGGHAVGLAAALAPDAFDALALLAPVDNAVAFYYTGIARTRRRATLAAAGVARADVERAFASLAPSTYPAPLTSRRLQFAIPPLDGVVPAESQERWRRAWAGERVWAGAHGHRSAIVDPLTAARAARALANVLA